ncbi:uncharacterized protein H6S33_001435 [Morchella sextelata]|uniref:uncharacterized protein n=1 Tax=Morchella sextelata TaxID=1174677 RepID=UPI001D037D3E|nr:uncharacterized protein H6S33_001435 [Morchella sextelata]KAH0609207.1 hypothetical protein H6S33_001435 [Morchella sextelata]
MPSLRKGRRNNYLTTVRGKRMRKAAPKPAQEDENDPATACGHIETDTCWCATAADKPGRGIHGPQAQVTVSPVDDGTPIDKDPFQRIPQLKPVFDLMSKETFTHGFIPASFKVLSLGTSDDRAMLANVMKTPAQQRKLCVYTLLRMAVFSDLDDLDGGALNVGDARPQLSPGTDHEADSHGGLTPMDIDSSSPPGMTCSYSAIALDECTARQPSAPPDLTQRQRQASGDTDGEEHTYCGGGGGGGEYEVMVPYSARDDIVAGAVRGGAASLHAQGYAPPKLPGLSITHTSAVDPYYNGLDHECRLDRMEKALINLGVRLDNRLEYQDTRLNNQKPRLDD